MIKPCLNCKKYFLAVVFSFWVLSIAAVNKYSVASGNWNSVLTWSDTPGGAPGATVPAKNDDVFIQNGHTVTVNSDNECLSVTFTGSAATLTVISPATLSVRNSITLNKQSDSNAECHLTGSGTIICVEVVVGSDANPPPAGPGSTTFTHTMISSVSNLNISIKGSPKNDLVINSYIGSPTNIRNGVFLHESGTITIDGKIITNNPDPQNISTFSMASGTQTGTLMLNGKPSPFSLSPTGTNTINLNGTSSLVNYSLAGAQTVLGTQYHNLTLSGTSAKTLTGSTVLSVLSMEGTATSAGTTPVFGPASALQYKGSGIQTTGIEFPASFTGSGGVIINNANGVVLNGNRTISSLLTFVDGVVSTGSYILNLTSAAAVSGAGAGKYVNGNLQKGISTGTLSKFYEIGDASTYAPVLIEFSGSVVVPGNITVKTTAGDHPNIGTSTFNAGVTVNRYWTLTNSGVAGFSTYNATFNFTTGDIDPGADFNYFYAGKYKAPSWTYPSIGSRTATSTQANGLMTFGDFQIGELPLSSYRTRQSGDWNQPSTWEAFDGTVWIPAISTPTSAAGYITIRSSHTVTNTSPVTADQVIIDAGGRLNLNSGITVNDGPSIDFTVSGILDCALASLSGPGSFTLNNLGSIIISSAEGITSAGATGNIQTTSRTFGPLADYTYRGAVTQVTGNGLPISVNNLIIDNAASVTLTSNVRVNGALSLNQGEFMLGPNTLGLQASDIPLTRNSGTLTTVPQSALEFGDTLYTGGVSFTLPGSLFTSDPELDHLFVYRSSGITLNEQVMTVSGIVLANGPLNTNDKLVLKSDVAATALIDGTGTAEITGSITMQRYLASGFGYKYLSSPFKASAVAEFGDDMDLLASFPTFYSYDESRTSAGWVNYTSPAGILAPLSGYAVNFGSDPAPKTIDVTGTAGNGIISAMLYNHNNAYTKGFNLCGNPYPSPIDWDADTGWTKTNIDDALYYFRASTTDEYGGTYSTYIAGVSSDGLATAIIPSMQGFFVHVTDGSYPVAGTLELNNAVRVTDLSHSLLKSESRSFVPLLRLSATFADDTTLTDPAVIYFHEKALGTFDPQFDALKLLNTDFNVPNLYSFSEEGSKLSINGIPPFTDSLLVIPLGLRLNREGNIVFRTRHTFEKLPFTRLYLTDKVTGIESDLSGKGEYRVYLREGDYANRFFLNLFQEPVGIPEVPGNEDDFKVYCTGGTVRVHLGLAGTTGAGSLTITSLTGQVLFIKSNLHETYFEFEAPVRQGVYIVTFTSGRMKSSRKIFIDN